MNMKRKKKSWLKTAREKPFSELDQIEWNKYIERVLESTQHHQMFQYTGRAKVWYKYGACPCGRCTRNNPTVKRFDSIKLNTREIRFY